MPFHVALAPVETLNLELPEAAAREASYNPKEDEASKPSDSFTLDLTSDRVTKGVEEALRLGFTKVTVLDTPKEEGFAVKASSDRNSYWHNRAKEVGADLWVQPTVQFENQIDCEINEKFWMNLPLFLIGGPFCYFFGDNTYTARVKLNAEFYDVARSEDGEVLSFPIQVDFAGTDLNFIERADDAGDYLLSILIPAGFLSRKSPQVPEEVRKQVIRNVADLFVREVHQNGKLFTRVDRIAEVELDHRRASVFRDGDTVKVDLPVDADEFEISFGDERVEGTLEGNPEGGFRWVRQEIAVPREASFLRVKLEDEHTHTRNFTLWIEPKPEEE